MYEITITDQNVQSKSREHVYMLQVKFDFTLNVLTYVDSQFLLSPSPKRQKKLRADPNCRRKCMYAQKCIRVHYMYM